MLRRSVLRSTAFAAAEIGKPSSLLSYLLASTAAAAVSSRSYYSAKTKTATKGKVRGKDPRGVSADDAAQPDEASSVDDDLNVVFKLPTDPLPGGHPLFSFTKSFSSLARKGDDFSLDECKAMLPEGLPPGMVKEFEETRRCAVMVRQSFLHLRDNFRRIVDPPIRKDAKNSKRQIVLDGLVSCGKSVTLAMLVHLARGEGWLVFYVPKVGSGPMEVSFIEPHILTIGILPSRLPKSFRYRTSIVMWHSNRQ